MSETAVTPKSDLPGVADSELLAFFSETRDTPLAAFHHALQETLETAYHQRIHGRTREWETLFSRLPALASDTTRLDQGTITISAKDQARVPDNFSELLMELHPWRKGPFELFNTFIDTEWRSDWKWDRLQSHIRTLENREVLDIGCGNGYHMLRMLGAGAKRVTGADPTRLFLYQFCLLKKYLGRIPVWLLPLKSEQLPAFGFFDTVFSMGVLYHRRSPLEHLEELHRFLRPGGELVLETLVIEGDSRSALIPEERYAKMGNVWFIPSVDMLELWLRRAGFTDIRTIDITRTDPEEQRATPWMQFQSLKDFLDPDSPEKTIEGYPAPTRAITLARRKPGPALEKEA